VTCSVTAIRLGKLGDLVMTLPALNWLASHEQIALTLICDHHYRDLMVELLPSGVEVSTPDLRDQRGSANVILDLHGVSASVWLSHRLQRGSRAEVVRVDKQTLLRGTLLRRSPLMQGPQSALASLLGGHEALLSWPQRHLLAAERVFSLLSLQPCDRPSAVPAASLEGRTKAGEGDSRSPVLGVVLDAAWDLKRWQIANFRELSIRWLAAGGGAVRLFAAPSRTELFEQFGDLAAASRYSSTSLVELAGDLEVCDVVVSGDTGPLHLAAALGCSLVGLFGPTPVASGFWVWENRGRLISAPQGCSPCSMHGSGRCRQSRRHCMDDIAVGEVLDACLQLVRGARRCA